MGLAAAKETADSLAGGVCPQQNTACSELSTTRQRLPVAAGAACRSSVLMEGKFPFFLNEPPQRLFFVGGMGWKSSKNFHCG